MDIENLMDLIATAEGAEIGLRQLGSRSEGGFDFFSSQLKTVSIIRKREKKKKKLNGTERSELERIYLVVLGLLQRHTMDVFQELVPRKEIAAWFDHTAAIFEEKANDPKWINTGALLRHDEILFSCFCQMLHHPLPLAMTFEKSTDDSGEETSSKGTKILEVIASMMISRKGASNKLPGPGFAINFNSLVFGIFRCATENFDNPWEPYKVFKKLDTTGIMEQYLRSTTIQSVAPLAETKVFIFNKLLRSTKFVRKRLKEGTPCGDTLRAIVEGSDGAKPICCYILPFLQDLIRLSTLCQIKEEATCWCCKETSLFENYMHCGRCKQAQYCSKECQRTDWKEHKKMCVEDTKVASNDLPRLSSAAVKQILKRAYVDIMVRLVEECNATAGLAMTDMVLELDFLPDESGRIPMLQDPPRFDIVPISRHQDGTRTRELQVAKGLKDVEQSIEFVEEMVTELTEKLSSARSEYYLLCAELHPAEWLYEFHQVFIKDRAQPMFTQEALDAFRVAMVDDDYSRLSSLFENEEIVQSYSNQIGALQSGSQPTP